jgi:hypothetical protein
MKKSAVLFLALFCVTLAGYADVSDSTWNALLGKDVVVERLDGSEVSGQLLAVQAELVSVSKADGRVVELKRVEVGGVRVSNVAPAPSSKRIRAARICR